jgi:hypothetical protein
MLSQRSTRFPAIVAFPCHSRWPVSAEHLVTYLDAIRLILHVGPGNCRGSSMGIDIGPTNSLTSPIYTLIATTFVPLILLMHNVHKLSASKPQISNKSTDQHGKPRYLWRNGWLCSPVCVEHARSLQVAADPSPRSSPCGGPLGQAGLHTPGR